MIRVGLNYKKEHILQVPFLLEKAFSELDGVELVSDLEDQNPEVDLVINSMPWNGIKRGKKTVYWELDIAEYDNSSQYSLFDIVYFPSRMKMELWPSHGKWLPMANDFDFYCPIEGVKLKKDLVFLGRLDRSLRSDYLERLNKKFNIEVGTRERGVPSAATLCNGACSFQISEFENLEQRNFEYSAVVPMVLERVKDIDVVFIENDHFKGFDRNNYQELEDQIRWCVENREEALEMRDRMIKHLKENHTYQHRAKQILEDVCLL